jgi:hypothetical protein
MSKPLAAAAHAGPSQPAVQLFYIKTAPILLTKCFYERMVHRVESGMDNPPLQSILNPNFKNMNKYF